MKRAKSVDDYYRNASPWGDELRRLRKILQSTELEETLKWGGPCYTLGGKNIVGVGGFKSYFGLWFYQGALLADQQKVLINAQEGKTRALRQWRMTDAKDIKATQIKRYVQDAIALSASGKEIKARRGSAIVIPPQLNEALGSNKLMAAAFRKLRPGQQREYADYIGEAKREETRQRRIARIRPMIIAGQGLNDKYNSS